ncbi:hypothetical protein PC128_g24101 [Phytophthora cactorum]|nr:hypothetical protein PC128_g24101 [Phytophthora cactorum]
MYGMRGGWSPRGSAQPGQACALAYAKFRLAKYEKSKKHKKHKKHHSQVPSAHSILTPSSSTSVATPLPSNGSATAYDNLYSPATHPYNTCFRAWDVDIMVFAPRGMDPRVVEDAIKENFDFAEPAPFRIAAGRRLGELGPDSDGGSEDADSADDGLGSPNTRGASLNTSWFGTPSPGSPSSHHDVSANSATAPADSFSSAPASVPPGSSAMGLLVAAATAASTMVAPQSMVSAPS